MLVTKIASQRAVSRYLTATRAVASVKPARGASTNVFVTVVCEA